MIGYAKEKARRLVANRLSNIIFALLVLSTAAFSETKSEFHNLIRSKQLTGELTVRITEPDKFQALFGTPDSTFEAKEGDFDLLFYQYDRALVIFGKRKNSENPAVWLSMMIDEKKVDIETGIPIHLNHMSDITKIDSFHGLQGVVLQKLNLRDQIDKILQLPFDTRTEWPSADKIPEGFTPDRWLKNAITPGLNIREIHKQDIDGTGVGIAIIDQPLLLGHEEYSHRLVRYDATGLGHMDPQMHASPVASIAVGKTLGVAPGSELSFFAVPMWERDNAPYIRVLETILSLNERLSADQKIRSVSISDGRFAKNDNYDGWQEILRRAEDSGVFVMTCDTKVFNYGMLSWNRSGSPEDVNSYVPGHYFGNGDVLLVPGGNRTLASHKGRDVYWFSTTGGMSWGAPYIAGLAALAFQVKPELTPEQIRALLVETATLTQIGPIVNPEVFIEKVKELE